MKISVARGYGLAISSGLMVLSVVGEQIGSLVAFLELSSFSSFILLPTLI